mmetsp:Transcript_16063/g.18178  ORF Transcript_16063/g.18178 Transcript_16063/m.18178 type:complete len:537 (+) Transcript_16063:326-1936(+)
MGMLKLEGEPTREDVIERAITGGLFAAGLLVAVQGLDVCIDADGCPDDFLFAIVFGAIIMLLVTIKVCNKSRNVSNPKFTFLFLPFILFLWSGFGILFFTFKEDGIFTSPVTGYFATWLCGGFSTYYFISCLNIYFERNSLVNPVMGIIVLTHLSVLVQAAQTCDGECSGRAVYAIIAALGGALYLVFLLVVMGVSENDEGDAVGRLFWFSLGLLVWWTAALIGTTTGEPFFIIQNVVNPIVANGFFGVWINFLGSMYLTYDFNARNGDPPISSQGLMLAFAAVFGLIVVCQGAAGGNQICFAADAAVAVNDPITASVVDKCQGLEKFSIAWGAIGTGVAALGCIMFTFTENGERLAGLLGVSLVILWVVGVGVLTFVIESPFYTANSGYFATWGAVITAFVFAARVEGSPVPNVVSFDSFNPRFALVIKSFLFGGLMLIGAAGSICNQDGVDCEGENLFALLAPIVTWFLLFMIVVFDNCASIFEYIMLLFWLGSVAYLTIFVGPFLTVDILANGFFSCWLLTLSSVLLVIIPRY